MKKKITIKDIAKECGVSITTVSRVLNNKEGCCSVETEQKILKAVKDTNYYPNPMARSLVTKTTNIIGVILPDIYNYFFQEFFKGAEDYLSDKGYRLILCNTDGTLKKENEFLDSLSQGLVDGIMITTGNTKEDNTHILELAGENYPIVTVERYGEDLKDIPKVLFDNKKGVKMAVHTLYENGHRKIAFLRGPSEAANAKLRYEGYLEGLKEVGLDYEECFVGQGDYKMDSGFRETMRLLKETDITGLVASNDLMAIGACKAAKELEKQVPDDLSIIGFDGTVLSEIYQPPLSTMMVHGYDMGKLSAENLLRLIRGKEIKEKKVVFAPLLREGKSVKKI